MKLFNFRDIGYVTRHSLEVIPLYFLSTATAVFFQWYCTFGLSLRYFAILRRYRFLYIIAELI